MIVIMKLKTFLSLAFQAGHDKLDDIDSDLNSSDVWLAEVNLPTVVQPHTEELSQQEADSIDVEQPVATSKFFRENDLKAFIQ